MENGGILTHGGGCTGLRNKRDTASYRGSYVQVCKYLFFVKYYFFIYTYYYYRFIIIVYRQKSKGGFYV
jgi:hypothetical protein